MTQPRTTIDCTRTIAVSQGVLAALYSQRTELDAQISIWLEALASAQAALATVTANHTKESSK